MSHGSYWRSFANKESSLAWHQVTKGVRNDWAKFLRAFKELHFVDVGSNAVFNQICIVHRVDIAAMSHMLSETRGEKWERSARGRAAGGRERGNRDFTSSVSALNDQIPVPYSPS